MDDAYIYLDYEAEFYPYCYINPQGALTGVYVELWRLIAIQLNKKIRWAMMRGLVVSILILFFLDIFENQFPDNSTSADGEMDPVERRIYNGYALTQVDTSFFAYEDASRFKPSVPFSYTKVLKIQLNFQKFIIIIANEKFTGNALRAATGSKSGRNWSSILHGLLVGSHRTNYRWSCYFCVKKS